MTCRHDGAFVQVHETGQGEVSKLRKAFDSKARKDFLKSITDDDLAKSQIPKKHWQTVREGKVPKGYQVHHIKPLDDNGTNAVDNLVLIKNSPDHQLVTNHQRYLTGTMKPGDSAEVPWPFYPEGTKIWPTPGMEAVPH